MGQINAEVAYAAGASGEGITVGVIDDGIDFSQPDLAGNISNQSIDVIPGRNQPGGGSERHGTWVSGPIASAHNGFGTVGVAYEATILSIRADRPENCPGGGRCFTTGDITAAVNAALDRGVQVINLSFGFNSGQNHFGAAFEAALTRAVAADAVILISSGNEGGAEAIWPARYAADPRFAGHVIAVGSSNAAGQMSGFSNRAGTAANSYIVAPGENIPVDCTPAACEIVSGTSFSAPHVAGAVALMMDGFPNLNAFSATEILLRTARDAGIAGTDPIFGRGFLDLERAWQPVGVTMAQAAPASAVPTIAPPWQHLGSPFGDAVAGSGALVTVGRDDYQRLFVVDLARAFPSRRETALGSTFAPTMLRADRTIDNLRYGSVSLSVERPIAAQPLEHRREFASIEPGADGGSDPEQGRHRFSIAFNAGPLTLSYWRGSTGNGDNAEPDRYAALAGATRGAHLEMRAGRIRATLEHGAGSRSAAPLGPSIRNPLAYSRLSIAGGNERLAWRARLGSVEESTGPLGSFMQPGTAFAMASRTDYSAAGATWRPRPGLWLDADIGLGRTFIPVGLLRLSEPALSSYWRFSATADCASLGWRCGFIRAELSQPLRVESGSFAISLADLPASYFAATTFSTRHFGAAPSGRQTDFRLSTGRRQSDGSELLLEAFGSLQPGHVRDARPDAGIRVGWMRDF